MKKRFYTTEQLKNKNLKDRIYSRIHRKKISKRVREWERNNPMKDKIIKKRAQIKFNTTPKRIYIWLKSNSRIRNRPIQISRDEFINWYNQKDKRCYYCGIKEDSNSKRLTIERKDNELPYSLANIEFACANCNSVKGNILTEKEMLIVGELIMRKRWDIQ